MANRTTAASLIESREYDVARIKERIKMVRSHRARTQKTIDLIYTAIGSCEEDTMVSVWDDVSPWEKPEKQVKLYVTLRVQAESMKEGIVPKLLASLLKYEFQTVSTLDAAADARREFRFERLDSPIFCDVQLTLLVTLLESETATCHRVQTGTKTVEVPLYELVCEGDTK